MSGFTYEDLNIVFEDNHIIVVVKPQNIPTQSDESGDVSMQTLLKEYLIKTYNKPGEAYLGTVHRLDRPTGGVMVFAKTSKAAARLSVAIAEKTSNADPFENLGSAVDKPAFEKIYYAVTCGVPKNRSGELVHYLKKNEKKNTVQAVPMATEGAKRAELNYKVIEEVRGYALVKINLLTGRSHQIRVQMAAVNTPVFGDAKYGAEEKTHKFNLALWASEIKFEHPVTHERMAFRVYPPKDVSPWKAFDISRHLNISNIVH